LHQKFSAIEYNQFWISNTSARSSPTTPLLSDMSSLPFGLASTIYSLPQTIYHISLRITFLCSMIDIAILQFPAGQAKDTISKTTANDDT